MRACQEAVAASPDAKQEVAPGSPGDQVLDHEVGGDQIIREIFDGPAQQILRFPFATGLDQ